MSQPNRPDYFSLFPFPAGRLADMEVVRQKRLPFHSSHFMAGPRHTVSTPFGPANEVKEEE